MNLSEIIPAAVRRLGRSRLAASANPGEEQPGLFGAKNRSPFAAPVAPRPTEVRLSPLADGLSATAGPRNARRLKRSWFGWLLGRNRRRETGGNLVQGELLLTQVRPVRNDFREDDATAGSGRIRSKVLYETPPTPERRDDQDHAWNRLRNRRTSSLVVKGE